MRKNVPRDHHPRDSRDDGKDIEAVVFRGKLPDLANEFDSCTYMKANGNPTNWITSLTLEEDADLTLNPVWRDAFLAFMEFSHLPPERLLVFGEALLAAYPPAPSRDGPRFPLTVDALERWLAKMYKEPDVAAYRAESRESLDDPDTLALCLATAPIELAGGQPEKLLGTLIIAFERRTETLLHHLIRTEPTTMEVLFLAEKLAQKAISRLGDKNFSEAWRHLVLPWPGRNREWSRGLYWLFEKNLPVAERVLSPSVRISEDARLDEESKLLKCRVQGRQFDTRFDLWSPIYYGVGYPFPVLESVNQEGVNEVHYLLARAAVSTRAALKRAAPVQQHGNPIPTWEVQSRARRKSTG